MECRKAAGHHPIALQLLDDLLQKLPTPDPQSSGEDTSDAIVDQALSEKHPALRIMSTHSTSLAKLENAIREQIASILALVEDPFAQFFADAGRVTESSLDTNVISVIQRVVNRALPKGFRSAFFYWAV